MEDSNFNSNKSPKSGHKIIDYINEHYDVRALYQEVTGRTPGNAKIYCPFHDNHNTPAAKIYGNSMKCFGECNRMFSPYDFIKRFFPEEIDKIKQKILVPETVKTHQKRRDFLKRGDLDLTLPIETIITKIIEHGKQV